MNSSFINPKPDGIGNIAYIIEHQNRRFKELRDLLDKNSSLRIIIDSNPITRSHALGTGFAKSWWETNIAYYNKMICNIIL